MSNLWRLHLRPAVKNLNHNDVVDYCINNNVASVGWTIDEVPDDFDNYLSIAERKHANKLHPVKRFVNECKIGDLIWTRGLNGKYYLGKISGDWFYNLEANYLYAANQRKCDWKKIGSQENIPGKIIDSFIQGSTFQRILLDRMLDFSEWLYNNDNSQIIGCGFPEIDYSRFFDFIQNQDLEDIVGLYLQHSFDYLLVPTSCKIDTMNYEFELKHKKSGKTAIAQVKNGKIDIDGDVLSHLAEDIYTFTFGEVTGTANNIKEISQEELYKFCCENSQLLTKRILYWINFIITKS